MIHLYGIKWRTCFVFQLTLLHEFHVLGSTQLSQLKDAILCPSDLAVAGDFSENPSFPQDVIAKVRIGLFSSLLNGEPSTSPHGADRQTRYSSNYTL